MIITPVNVGFLLHFYQPPTQDAEVFQRIYAECYLPLLKLVKFYKGVGITFNLPLSFLEQLEKYGHRDWIDDAKELYNQDRLELVSCAAYHPILTKLQDSSITSQIILNEYGLGYYFGMHKGFEGENALMVKNINGFFPPELAIDERVAETIFDLGYTWLLCENYSVSSEKNEKKSCVYRYRGEEKFFVTRDSTLSNLISFKRDTDISDIINYIYTNYDYDSGIIVALDAEAFGHHNKDGVDLLEAIIKHFNTKNIKVSKVAEIIANADYKETNKVELSSWSMYEKESMNPLDLWDDPTNELQIKLWDLLQNSEKYIKDTLFNSEGYETIPVWNFEYLEEIKLANRTDIMTKILLLKAQNSDQFWWTSGREIGGKKLLDMKLVLRNLDLYDKLGIMNPDFENTDILDELRKLVNKNTLE